MIYVMRHLMFEKQLLNFFSSIYSNFLGYFDIQRYSNNRIHRNSHESKRYEALVTHVWNEGPLFI